MRKYVAEATGAFFIVVSLGISTDAIGIGFTFAALYMIFSGTSGGHFNPAVSLAFLIRRDLTPKQFGGYFLSQTVGVFLGAALILYLSGFVVYAEPPSSTNLYQQSIIEFLMTFVLVMVYLKTKTTRMEQNRILNAVILGITMIGIILIGREMSGAIYNPALSFGISIVDYMAVKGISFYYLPLYSLAPLAGATSAVYVNSYLVTAND